MSEELKTLKDLEGFETTENDYPELVYREELKAEAVKWVKDRKQILKNKTSTDLARMKAVGMIIDFEDFFNLTEEDLG